MKVLLEAAARLNVDLGDEDVKKSATMVSSLSSMAFGAGDWNSDIAAAIGKLWREESIQHVYGKRDKEFQLNDSAEYFFSSLGRFAQPDYMPSTEDILRSRVRTTGIDEAVFRFDRISYKITDVGGQRNERRKWIHCFDSVTAVMFCASLAGYDQVLREDEKQNRLREALMLFEEMVNSPWFKQTTFILFLNKIDLFEDKLPKVPLTCCFKNYDGGADIEKAKAFVRGKFQERYGYAATGALYVHVTCAIDTSNIIVMWKAVREIILKKVFSEIGIV
jgi:G-protein alpha subunit